MEQGSEENMESSWTLLSGLASGVMVFGGAVPYIPQYQDIQRTNNAEGFSTRVCLVLLVANILRIFFWIGKQFELPLLLQSVVMILTMLAMLHLCCSIQSSNRVSSKQHHITDLDLRYFWSWGSFEDYLIFCFAFTLLCAFITFLFLDWVLFVEALGSLAVMFEAMLGMPQLLQNYNNRSTRGMRRRATRSRMNFCFSSVPLWTFHHLGIIKLYLHSEEFRDIELQSFCIPYSDMGYGEQVSFIHQSQNVDNTKKSQCN
uniref:Si:dkey-246g23.2 n=1 Tax=Cyprinus carpio TaxID=7962 RepID=A0A8C1L741_CYPCA